MKPTKELIRQSETVTVNRSQINFAPYNPRKQDKKVVEALKKNFKKVGFLGGIQWNVTTSNLIGGHKRLEALDLINKYVGTLETDYEVRVEKIALDEKTEKEQNIFLNSKRVQGETDFEKLAAIFNDIDYLSAGMEDFDVKIMESIVPNFQFAENEDIKADIKSLKTEKEKIEHVKNVKKAFKSDVSDQNTPSHITITFETYNLKAEYLESMGINGDTIYITSETFFSAING